MSKKLAQQELARKKQEQTRPGVVAFMVLMAFLMIGFPVMMSRDKKSQAQASAPIKGLEDFKITETNGVMKTLEFRVRPRIAESNNQQN
jgi:hypothetical protein